MVSGLEQMKWQPIETIPKDLTLKRIRFANGKEVVAPGLGLRANFYERKQLAKRGIWPDHKAWKATHWKPI